MPRTWGRPAAKQQGGEQAGKVPAGYQECKLSAGGAEMKFSGITNTEKLTMIFCVVVYANRRMMAFLRLFTATQEWRLQ